MERNEVYLIHGTDYKKMTETLLEHMDLQAQIGSRDQTVALKPNLVLAADPSEGATTHPEIVEGILEYLQANGFRKIKVIEGSWVGDRTSLAVQVTGLQAVCDRFHVPFYDLQKDSSREYDAKGVRIKICDQAMSTDYLINIPVMKGHCQTTITCALKNAKGLIPNSEKRRFHTMGLHKPIAHLNAALPRGCVIVDNICGDLDFEEGGNPVRMDRIFGCLDPVLCDAFVCQSMGYTTEEVPYIGMAARLGVGSADLSRARIVALNEAAAAANLQPVTRKIGRLANHVRPDCACSACYGSLIYALNKLDNDGLLRRLKQPVCIGQGWKGKDGQVGIGACTGCFAHSLRGCPPTAAEIYRFLKEQL